MSGPACQSALMSGLEVSLGNFHIFKTAFFKNAWQRVKRLRSSSSFLIILEHQFTRSITKTAGSNCLYLFSFVYHVEIPFPTQGFTFYKHFFCLQLLEVLQIFLKFPSGDVKNQEWHHQKELVRLDKIISSAEANVILLYSFHLKKHKQCTSGFYRKTQKLNKLPCASNNCRVNGNTSAFYRNTQKCSDSSQV